MQVINDNFLAIQSHIQAKLLLARTIDLWNDQIDYESQENAQFYPAYYIEYSPITWSKASTARIGTGTVTIHVCTVNVADSHMIDGTIAENQNEALKRFAHTQALQYIIEGFQHATCKPLELISSTTDHNHNAVIHDTMQYKITLIDTNLYNANDVYNVATVMPPFVVEANTVPEIIPEDTGFTLPPLD